MNTLGVAGQKHFAGRWLNGAQINGTRIGNNLGAPTDGDVYFDTTHWTVAGTDGTPPMFVFNNCGFSVDRPVSVANKVLVGFNGMMQGTPVAANSFPLLEHPGQFHLPNADIGNPMKLGPLPTYFWTDAQGHLRMDKAAPSIDADGAILVPQQRGNGSPLPAGLNVTPYFAGAEYYDFTNNTWYKALGTTATDWRPIADQGADMVAASTLDLSLSTGDVITVTGNTTITALGTMPAGVQKTLNFTGAPTLTHNATSLIIPGASNIALSSGNVVDVLSIGSGNWKVIGYSAAGFNATQLVAGTMPAARLPVSAITSGTISGVDLQLRTFTVATLPSAATVGRIIYVSDGTGNNRVATSNGTNWVWLNTATVVS